MMLDQLFFIYGYETEGDHFAELLPQYLRIESRDNFVANNIDRLTQNQLQAASPVNDAGIVGARRH